MYESTEIPSLCLAVTCRWINSNLMLSARYLLQAVQANPTNQYFFLALELPFQSPTAFSSSKTEAKANLRFDFHLLLRML